MAAINYVAIFNRVRSRQFLGVSEAILPDEQLDTPARDFIAQVMASYPCLGTEESLSVSGVEERQLELSAAAWVSATLLESGQGQDFLGAQSIKQGTVQIARGGTPLTAEQVAQRFWRTYASALRSISCVSGQLPSLATFATSASERRDPLNVLEDAFPDYQQEAQ